MYKMACLWLVLGWGLALQAENVLIANGSFEEQDPQAEVKWEAKGNYWQGKGTVLLTDKEASQGKYSVEMCGLEPKSAGQCQSGHFFLQPDVDYRVGYSVKRESNTASGHLIIYYETEQKQNGMLVCHAAKNQNSIAQWLRVERDKALILFFLPEGSAQKYVTLKNGIIRIPSEAFGSRPIKCRAQLYMSGHGKVWFDDIAIDKIEAAKKQTGFLTGAEAAKQEEAERLMQNVLDKSDGSRTVIAKNKYQLQLPENFIIPPAVDYDYAKYPESIRNTVIEDGRVLRNGKPVFLIGCEMLDPFMCKLLGFDFWVNSAFGNKVNARLEGDTVKTYLTQLPFLEEQVRERLKAGILVWIDLLQDYKVWHSKHLTENFPELFITREAFFCWRPEEPRAQFLRQATWWNAIKHTRKYPVFAYELFNEVSYEDHSSYNYDKFRESMRAKYQTVENANRIWGTDFKAFADVRPQEQKDISSLLQKKSPQLKADWSLFTEQRFAEIAGECLDWIKKAVPNSNYTLQSYNGLQFDYHNNFINPYLVNPQLSFTAAEFGMTVYPQWEDNENEQEIVSSSASNLKVALSRNSAPGKVIIDGECGIGPGIKFASEKNIVVDLNGEWYFRPGEFCPESELKYGGCDIDKNIEDAGRKENWQLPSTPLAAWSKIKVPGMWGTQGFKQVRVGWYRKDFNVPGGQRRLYLAGSELADRAEIYLNGELIHRTVNFNEKFCLDISARIKADHENTLVIRIFNGYFLNEYFWGGIREPINLVNSSFEALPMTAEQLAFCFSSRALHGYSGLCWSYFHRNWVDKFSQTSLLNPQFFPLSTLAALPAVKNRINDLGTLIFSKTSTGTKAVGFTYSLASARTYDTSSAIPTQRIKDLERSYASLLFTHRKVEAISDPILENLDSLSKYQALILRLNENVSEKTLENLQDFVQNGGILVVDRLSLSRGVYDNLPLNTEKLLGVRRSQSISETLDGIQVEGIEKKFRSIEPGHRDAGQYAELQLLPGTQAFAQAKNKIVGSVCQRGKGRVYVFTPELSAGDMREVYRKIFEQSAVLPELYLSEAPYVEVVVRSDKQQRYLWSIFNWGQGREIKVCGLLPAGSYHVREAFSKQMILSPSGQKTWTAAALRDEGIVRLVENLTPCHYLIENISLPQLPLTELPAAQQKALQELFLPIAKDLPDCKKRVLWYGDNHYNPSVMPTAVKILRQMEIAVDTLLDKGFAPEIHVGRNGGRELASLYDYSLIVIPRSRGYLKAEQTAALTEYLNRGGSLLVLAGHTYNFHSNYNARMEGISKIIPEISLIEGAIEDSAHARAEEPRRFNTGIIKAHPVTKNVACFAAMGSTGMKLNNASALIEAEPSASLPNGAGTILAICERGMGRIALSGDLEWLSAPGLELEDNAVLWSNLAAWLCRTEPLKAEDAKKAALLPLWSH